MKKLIENYILDTIDIRNEVVGNAAMIQTIENIAIEIEKAYRNGNKVLLAGNGGSAADAQHIAGELINKLYFDRPPLSAVALSVDTSVMTAIGNDFSFDNVFSRQVEANGTAGDVFIGISTSGNSLNVVKAIKEANKKNLVTVGLTGEKSCEMDDICDYLIKVPSSETPKIQETHIMIGHILCKIVEKNMFS